MHLAGVRDLNVSYCVQLSHRAFEHLGGVRVLNIGMCSQLTDAALAHCGAEVAELTMYDCTQIGDGAFTHLKKLRKLVMWRCSQLTDAVRGEDPFSPYPFFKNALPAPAPSTFRAFSSSLTLPRTQAFADLGLLEDLDMYNCCSEGITDAAFAHLHSLRTLSMADCKQPTITDAAFPFFGKLETLNMQGCTQASITAAAFQHLQPEIHLILDETRREQVEAHPLLLNACFCPPCD